MICDNKQQAVRVATAGAKTMTAQGYFLINLQKPLPLDVCNEFRVENRQKGVSYRVNLHNQFCTCKFHAENAQFKVCKHIIWCANEKADLLQEIEYQKYENARLDELEARYPEAFPKNLTDGGTTLHEEYMEALEQGARF